MTVPPSLDELRRHPVVAVDVNDAHLDVAVIAPDGNPLGTPLTLDLPLAAASASVTGHRGAGGADATAPCSAAFPPHSCGIG
ncbi:MAG TPA: hypothetical protein VLZ05_09740 [Mycobacterium sp.]|nr:hypothetical protein [Mycobacterium sp.]HUH69126.1 hypothetical protein [Mycobacterium sp.]